MRADVRCYYILYAARYFQAVISVLIEPKRKDFIQMMVHHVVTLVVIFFSYFMALNHIGVVVMFILDPADVPLHLAKLCRYTAVATKQRLWQFMGDRLFEIFAVSFFVTRMIFYGYVCWSAQFESWGYYHKFNEVPRHYLYATYTCLMLLHVLLALQVYWCSLLVKVIVKMLRDGESVEDVRSDDEEEDEPTGSDRNNRNATKSTERKKIK